MSTSDNHEKLKGFTQHGVNIKQILAGSGQAEASCPFCGKDKMYINTGNLLWDCKVCASGGNLQAFWERKLDLDRGEFNATTGKALAQDRNIKVSTFKLWQVGWSGVNYVYPVYTQNKSGALKLSDLRRYQPGKKALSTKGGKSGLLMPKKWVGKGIIWVCEGEWDAMAWSEVLRRNRIDEDVCGVCGAGNFPKHMKSLFRGRDVVFLFDHDQPGQVGLKRAWIALEGSCKSRRRLEWEDSVASGYDIRDLYNDSGNDPRKTLSAVKKALSEEPPRIDTADGTTPAHINTHEDDQPTGDGLTPAEVEKGYKKWLDMVDTDALDVIFGTVFANRIDADPLWLFVVAPPGGSKSELLMSLADAPLIHCTTSLTPHALISGMDFAGCDPSLIPKIIGKTLVVKDFTAILSMNQNAKEEIFGALRDAYDGRTSKKFGNNIERVYEGKFGIIGGVTQYIDKVGNQDSILGERFIKYRIRRLGQVKSQKKTILKALSNIIQKTSMRDELREIGTKALDRKIDPKKDIPHIPSWFMDKVADLATWVAQMRATVDRERYTRELTFKPVAEVGTRLAVQFCTLGLGVGIYRGLKELDDTVYRIVTHVAAGTVPDKVEAVVRAMFVRTEGECSTAEVADWTSFGSRTAIGVLDDLQTLKVVYKPNKGRWCLTDRTLQIMHDLNLYSRERAWRASR